MNEIKPIFELLMWNNCNNACKFCHMHNKPHKDKFLSAEHKAVSIQKAKEFLDSPIFQHGSHLLLVGGELFDTKFTPSVEKAFFSLVDKVCDYMTAWKINLLYVNTNLIYGDTAYLRLFLDKINRAGLLPRLKFTTSYDLYGRFATKTAENIMLSNLKDLKSTYGPELHIVANIIMTKQACSAIIDQKFSVKDFINTYNVDVNMIPYIILGPDLAPTREQIYNTLIQIDSELPGYINNYLENLTIIQPKYLYEYNGSDYVYMTEENAPCGHNKNFYLYQPDHKSCFICDMKKLSLLS